MTNREELHTLIDQLSEAEIQYWLDSLRRTKATSSREKMRNWSEEVEPFQAKLREKYGELPSSLGLLKEVREERLNDLMGGR
jgi:hypothetical protein